jgi:hypothetical protein
MSLATEPQVLGSFGRIAERFADADDRQFELIRWMEKHGYGSTPWEQIPTAVLEQARRELGHPQPPRPPAPKTFAAPSAEKRLDAAEVASHATSPGKPGATPVPTTPVHVAPAPATPAEEEETMPRGKLAEPRKCCGSLGTKHKADCPEVGGKPAPKPKASAAPAKVTRLEKPRRVRGVDADLEAMKIPDLQEERERCLARAAAVTAELKRRREEINDALGETGSTRSTGTEG